MSNFVQHGSQDYLFGYNDPDSEAIAAAVGLKPQTLKISSSPEFESEGKNEDGLTEAFVVGPDKFEFTLSGYVVDKALFNATGISFTFESKKFIVTGKSRDLSNSDFQKGELSGVAFALIAE